MENVIAPQTPRVTLFFPSMARYVRSLGMVWTNNAPTLIDWI